MKGKGLEPQMNTENTEIQIRNALEPQMNADER